MEVQAKKKRHTQNIEVEMEPEVQQKERDKLPAGDPTNVHIQKYKNLKSQLSNTLPKVTHCSSHSIIH